MHEELRRIKQHGGGIAHQDGRQGLGGEIQILFLFFWQLLLLLLLRLLLRLLGLLLVGLLLLFRLLQREGCCNAEIQLLPRRLRREEPRLPLRDGGCAEPPGSKFRHGRSHVHDGVVVRCYDEDLADAGEPPARAAGDDSPLEVRVPVVAVVEAQRKGGDFRAVVARHDVYSVGFRCRNCACGYMDACAAARATQQW